MNSTHPRSFNANEPAVNLHPKYGITLQFSRILNQFRSIESLPRHRRQTLYDYPIIHHRPD